MKLLRTLCAALWWLTWAGSALALSPDQALRIAQGDSDDRIAALNEVVLAADPALTAYVQALLADEVKLAGGKAYIVRGESDHRRRQRCRGHAAGRCRRRGQSQPRAARA